MSIQEKMNEDRARGMERKWIMAVRRWFKKFDASKNVYSICHILGISPCPISAGHALEGVRCNGHQRLVTAMRVKHELVQFREELIKNAERLHIAAEEANEEITALENEWDINWDKCKACKGRCGFWEHRETGKIDYKDSPRSQGWKWDWRDCEKCNGRGLCEAF